MYARFVENLRAGRPPDYPGDDLLATTVQYLRASAVLQAGTPAATIDLGDGDLTNPAATPTTTG